MNYAAIETEWRNVGKLLKAVDVTLYSDWLEWTDDAFPKSMVATAWDSFPPTDYKKAPLTPTQRTAALAELKLLSKPHRTVLKQVSLMMFCVWRFIVMESSIAFAVCTSVEWPASQHSRVPS